ncbi:MAG TPA: hypothetical protein PLP92_17615 [Rhodocyclaceae bacterium]|nr:hypothetical protein [Rhodocyclaceae bacterium]
MALLRGEGIPVDVRGLSYRQVTQFFGPLLPVELRVATADVERATALLDAHLGGARAPGRRPPTPPPPGQGLEAMRAGAAPSSDNPYSVL